MTNYLTCLNTIAKSVECPCCFFEVEDKISTSLAWPARYSYLDIHNLYKDHS